MSVDHPTPEERRAVAQERLTQAREALDAACVLLDSDHGTAATNRLYYACFYAAGALLVMAGHTPKTHSGTRTLLHQHFFRTSSLDLERAALYDELLEARTAGDYEDFVTIDAERATRWLPQAEAFIEEAAALIESEPS